MSHLIDICHNLKFSKNGKARMEHFSIETMNNMCKSTLLISLYASILISNFIIYKEGKYYMCT